MANCPSTDTLKDLAAGRLAGTEAATLAKHVDGCASCAQALTRLVLATVSETIVSSPGVRVREVLGESRARYAPVVDGRGAEVELGRGGIGRVVLVQDELLGRNVAMKELLAARLEGGTESAAGVEARFLREARVTGQLEHPAIVPVHDVGQRPDGSLYYTMRRIRGRTLAKAIADAKSLEERLKLMPHVLAACQALAFAHSRHVVHRDVKPQNVMVDRFGETYVVDWGLARVHGQDEEEPKPPRDVEQSGPVSAPDLTSGAEYAVVGTPAYMAPEQLAGRIAEVNERSDVWGLGCVLYELLTARLPRELASRPGEPYRFAPVRPVLVVEPRAPKELAAICTKALREDPAQRYASAEELAADVSAWMSGRQVGAYAYRARDLLKRFASRYRAPLAVAAVALLALLVLGVQSVRRVQAERDDARDLAKLILGDVGMKLEPVPGALPIVEAVTKRALDFYQRVGAEEGLTPAEREDMAWAVARLLQTNEKLGRNQEARRLAALCDQVIGPPEGVARTRPGLLGVSVMCVTGLSTVARNEGETAEVDRLLEEGKRRLALGRREWDDRLWLAARSVLASSVFHRAYMRDDLEDARHWAEEAVDADKRALAQAPTDPYLTIRYSRSLLDDELVTAYTEGVEQALPLGEEALRILRALPHAQEDTKALAAIASAATQHQQVVGIIAGDAEAAKPLYEEAKRAYRRLVYLEPDTVDSRCDFGTLLLRGNEVRDAFEQLQRVVELGGELDCETSYAEAALLLGKPEVAVARRASLEKSGLHYARWVLAVALAVTGDPHGGAEQARAMGEEDFQLTEWPPGALLAYAHTVPGPVGRAVERFAVAYEAQYAAQREDDDPTPEWKAVFERFADELDDAAADVRPK